jgi:hypothetical protein
MRKLNRDLRDYYQRRAESLLEMATQCTDPDTRQKLMDMANEYIEQLEAMPGEARPTLPGATRRH